MKQASERGSPTVCGPLRTMETSPTAGGRVRTAFSHSALVSFLSPRTSMRLRHRPRPDAHPELSLPGPEVLCPPPRHMHTRTRTRARTHTRTHTHTGRGQGSPSGRSSAPVQPPPSCPPTPDALQAWLDPFGSAGSARRPCGDYWLDTLQTPGRPNLPGRRQRTA